MPETVIDPAPRTPIARAHKGSLVDVDAFDLAEVVLGEVIGRSGVAASEIDDIVLAEQLQGGGVIGRNVAVKMGLSHIPALADNRHCASGMSALQIAAGSIRAGMDRVVVAGGTESVSTMPLSTKGGAPWMPLTPPAPPEAPAPDMPITAGENTARLAGVSRRDSDEWALASHLRAADARDSGRFDEEIVPVGSFARDEHPRADSTIEKLSALPPLHPELEGATVTAGNSSGLNDAAAAVVMTSSDYAAAHGLAPMGRVVSWASVGVDPARTGLAPTLAIPKALERAGLTTADVDLWEINEAFCSMAVASSRILGLDHDIVNVNGSGCGLGHPIAATGARMVVTMLHELRRRGQSLGCVAMCAGGGMGSALVVELR
jgi:acetyl-CoA C-acetyltransferase